MNWITEFSNDVKTAVFNVLKSRKILYFVIACQLIFFLINLINFNIALAIQNLPPPAEGSELSSEHVKLFFTAGFLVVLEGVGILILAAFLLNFFLNEGEKAAVAKSIFRVMGTGAVYIIAKIIITFILSAPLMAAEKTTQLQILGTSVFAVIFDILLLVLFYLSSGFAVKDDKLKLSHFKISFDLLFSNLQILFAAVSYYFVRFTVLALVHYFLLKGNLAMIFLCFAADGILLAVFLNYLCLKIPSRLALLHSGEQKKSKALKKR